MTRKKADWMTVEMDKDPKVMIVDCGYVNEPSARDRADAIFALGISRSNLIWGPSTGQPRIHINIPKTKQKAIIEALPISSKKSWFGATHSYLGEEKKKDKT